MPHAPDLGGGFLFGEGVHGYTKPDGHYMDDLWFYDVQRPPLALRLSGLRHQKPAETDRQR